MGYFLTKSFGSFGGWFVEVINTLSQQRFDVCLTRANLNVGSCRRFGSVPWSTTS